MEQQPPHWSLLADRAGYSPISATPNSWDEFSHRDPQPFPPAQSYPLPVLAPFLRDLPPSPTGGYVVDAPVAEVADILSYSSNHAVHRHMIINGFSSMDASHAEDVFNVAYNLFTIHPANSHKRKRKSLLTYSIFADASCFISAISQLH